MKKKCKKRQLHYLYKIEQFVILASLLCFACLGIVMPPRGELSLSDSSQPKQESVQSDNLPSKVSPEQPKTIPDPSVSEAPSTDETVPSGDSTQSGNTAPENSSENTPSNTSPTPDGSTQPETQNPSETPESPSNSETQEKEWVPPVYEIIHHEAVYETRTVYICSGTINEDADVCNEVFESLEKWSSHKSIHGG